MFNVIFLQMVHQVCSVALRSHSQRQTSVLTDQSDWDTILGKRSLSNRGHPHLDLLIWGDSTEDNFGEPLRWEHSKTDSSNHTSIFDQWQCLVLPVHGEKIVSHRRYKFNSEKWWQAKAPPTDQRPAVWCTPWAYEAAGERRHSGGRPATSGSAYWASGWESFQWHEIQSPPCAPLYERLRHVQSVLTVDWSAKNQGR